MCAKVARPSRVSLHIPKTIEELLPDDTLTLALRGYPFIRDTCQRLGRDIFETRFFLERTTCLTGPEAAAVFYDASNFERAGSAPTFLQKTLFGEGGVQGLDGPDHEHRKALFMSCFDKPALSGLALLANQKFDERTERWEEREEVVLLDELAEMFCEMMMTWCGIPIAALPGQTRDFRLLIEGAVPTKTSHLRARAARKRLDEWLEQVVNSERRTPTAPRESVLSRFCRHTDLNGNPLPSGIVAVELNNMVRPTVAVAWYCTALAVAMHHHPDLVPPPEDARAQGHFITEVRRLHPFFPMVAARATRSVEFQGQTIPKGRLTLLDLFGTNRDARTYDHPEQFLPRRFEQTPIQPHTFIPQGGGDHFLGHRCAGEWLTEELMRLCLSRLSALSYAVPRQDLSISWTQIPARPSSGFVLRKVRRQKPAAA